MKSLISKAVSNVFGIPLIRLDVGKVMDRYVGGSEANMRSALDIIESASPCVTWLDEIDKSLSGTQSSSFSDSGTLSRVFGTFLTWLQENKRPIFVVATCNAMVHNNQLILPPELQRKGRFDQIFYVDLPTIDESKEIIAIHLRKRGRNPDKFDLDAIARYQYVDNVNAHHGFTGSEYEAAIVEAMFSSFPGEITTESIIDALAETIPISYSMKNTIDELRKFGRERCVPASGNMDRRSKDTKDVLTTNELVSNLV